MRSWATQTLAYDQPIAFRGRQVPGIFCPGRGPHAGPTEEEGFLKQAWIRGRARVVVETLRVDGVDLRIAGSCRTALFDLSLESPDVYDLQPGLTVADSPFLDPADKGQTAVEYIMTNPYFKLTSGGLLTARFEVPAFSGCRTATGEDVSRLLTAAVSGPGTTEVRSQAMEVKALPLICGWTYSCDPDPLPALSLPTG